MRISSYQWYGYFHTLLACAGRVARLTFVNVAEPNLPSRDWRWYSWTIG
jgi:hypothetical protein